MTTQRTPSSNEKTYVSDFFNFWGIRFLVNLYPVIGLMDVLR